MLTVTALVYLAAFVLAIAGAYGVKAPLWVAVTLLAIAGLLRTIPL